jgi:hypothetical protein
MWKLKNAPSWNTSSRNSGKSFTMPNISDYFFLSTAISYIGEKIPMHRTKGWILFLTKLWHQEYLLTDTPHDSKLT